MNLFEDLAAPFPPEHVRWRPGASTQDKTKGIALPWIDARRVMDRLDEVTGGLWQDAYSFPVPGRCMCRIGLMVASADDWVWREDSAADQIDDAKAIEPEKAKPIEPEKGAITEAFRRAAVKWGIGRYLYYVPTRWVALKKQGKSYVLAEVPQLPAWALPKGPSSGSQEAAARWRTGSARTPSRTTDHKAEAPDPHRQPVGPRRPSPLSPPSSQPPEAANEEDETLSPEEAFKFTEALGKVEDRIGTDALMDNLRALGRGGLEEVLSNQSKEGAREILRKAKEWK